MPDRPHREHLALVPNDLSLEVSAEEVTVLREVLAAAYQRQHREVFDANLGDDAEYQTVAAQRLEVLAALLKRCGASDRLCK